jgi:serine/threonine protein kinase
MTSASPDSTPEFGKFHLVTELARGGMGNVYLAVAHGPGDFNKLVVVKALKPELAEDETYVGMFLQEARLAARLIHPNIVQTNEVGSEGRRHYMVMEYLDGRSLQEVGRRVQSLPVGAHLRVIAETLRGLHYANELRDFDGEPLGIVHRDVSPHNVMVTYHGQAKLLDFGIARALDSSLETAAGTIKGRIAYMAPEQARGGKVDRRADIYSVGVMIWEAAAGRRLWPGMTNVEILSRVLHDAQAPRLHEVCPGVGGDLDALCAACMAPSCEDRPANAAELLADLEKHLSTRRDVMTMREIGASIGRAFAVDRGRMSALLDETLARVRGPRSGVMAAIASRGPDVLDAQEDPKVSFVDPEEGPERLVVTPTRNGHQAPPLPAPTQPWSHASSWRPMMAMTAASALAVIGVVVAAEVHRDRSIAASRPAPAPSPTAPLGEGDPLGPGSINLIVRASPPSARVTVDGSPAAGSPLEARYPKDGRIHHVIVFADGYDPKLSEVSFANDAVLDVGLERQTTAVARPSLPAQPSQPVTREMPRAAAALPGPPSSGAAIGRTPLPIMTTNPYGGP